MYAELIMHLERLASRTPDSVLLDELLREWRNELIGFYCNPWDFACENPSSEARALTAINWLEDLMRETPIRGETFDALLSEPIDAKRTWRFRCWIASNKHLTVYQIARLMKDPPIPWDSLSHRANASEWLLWACAWTWLATLDNGSTFNDRQGVERQFEGGSEEAVLTLGLRMYSEGQPTIMPFESFLEIFGKRSNWLVDSLRRKEPATGELRLAFEDFLARH